VNVTTAKATLVAPALREELSTETEVGIDPAVLQTILQVILSLVTAFTGCKVPAAQVAAIAAKPRPFHKMRVRRAVPANTDQPIYDLHGKEVVQGVRNVAATTTEADMVDVRRSRTRPGVAKFRLSL
jgi:hypothetical protein